MSTLTLQIDGDEIPVDSLKDAENAHLASALELAKHGMHLTSIVFEGVKPIKVLNTYLISAKLLPLAKAPWRVLTTPYHPVLDHDGTLMYGLLNLTTETQL